MHCITLHIVTALSALGVAGLAEAAPETSHPAVQRALSRLAGEAFQAAQASASDAYQATDLAIDADGAEHVRFDRSHKGLPVVAGDLVVHSGPEGQWLGLSQTLAQRIALSVRPTLSATQAGAFALSRFSHHNGAVQGQRLVVYARSGKPQLAWDIQVNGVQPDGTPSQAHLIVGAHGKKLLDRWDDIQTADALGSGNTLYSGTVALHGNANQQGSAFQLMDLTRGKHSVVTMKHTTTTETRLKDADNVWGNGKQRQPQTVAADAAYGQNVAWDYYQSTHGRTGMANDGRGGRSRVHYGDHYDGAFWDGGCFCLNLGDGSVFKPFVSLDIIGHEMTHGVIQTTARLINSGESGALSEGTADLFGSMIEFFAHNANDPGDYLIGEEISKVPGQALRSMVQPSEDGFSADCWYSGVGGLDVHYSAGVANHFYYLLAEGTTNGVPSRTCVSGNTKVATGSDTLVGIGRAAAEKIWYRALVTRMVSSETFALARAHTLAAAEELYGAGSTQALAVAAAWTAVNRP